jgi:Carbohydrate esterase, sialic acid-specific acetylesterase
MKAFRKGHKRLMAYRARAAALAICSLFAACGLKEHPLGTAMPPVVPPPPTGGSGSPPPENPPPPPAVDAAAPPPQGPPRLDAARPGVDAAATAPLDAATPPPVAGPGVTINGRFVPKDHALVFVHYGHSNMAGHGINPTSLRPLFYDTDPHLWTYQGNNQFTLAREPTAPDNTNGAGPGMAWLKTALAKAGPDYYFISIAKGRGSAHSDEFMKGGLYYSTFMDRAVQLKGKVTFAGVFVMLGITERHMPLNLQGGFADRTVQTINDIRADLGEPNLPVLHTDYEVTATGSLGVDTDLGRRIRPLILSLPQRLGNVAIIPTDQITLEDDHHFTLAGHKLWVERGVQIMIDRGWFPWGPR